MTRRVVWPRAGEVSIEEGPELSPTGKQVLVDMSVSLVSPGTERAFFLGSENTSRVFPIYPGYSSVGTVVATGPEVSSFECGKSVFVSVPHCSAAVVDEEKAIGVPSNLLAERAVLAKMCSIALQGIRRAALEIGEQVTVFGAGLIGLLAAQCAYVAGASRVALIDPDEARRRGATQVLPAESLEVALSVNSVEWAHCANVVVEASGNPEAVVEVLEAAPRDARVVLLGSSRGLTRAVNFYELVHKKGLMVIGAHDNARPRHESSKGHWTQKDDLRVSLELLAQGRLGEGIGPAKRYSAGNVGRLYEDLVQKVEAPLLLIDWHEPS